MKHAHVFAMLVFAVLTGTITDKTTGQPLEGVTVTTTAGSHALQAHTNAHGHFTFPQIEDGTYTLRFSSNDVPAQTVRVHVRGTSTHVTFKACSMTLDYTCGDGSSGGG